MKGNFVLDMLEAFQGHTHERDTVRAVLWTKVSDAWMEQRLVLRYLAEC